jgi:GNAT superfamily N-acetyltransferase
MKSLFGALMTIMPARIEHAASIAAVHIECLRETYAGIVPADFLASLSQEKRSEMWHRTLSTDSGEFVFVAIDEHNNIVGFASGGKERSGDGQFDGELYALYLLRSYHGKGIGRSLFLSVVDGLLARGLGSMLIWCLADNPFRAFYVRQGGSKVREKSIEIAGTTLLEEGYGWKPLSNLVES